MKKLFFIPKALGMLALGATLLSSCEKTDDEPAGIYQKGVFIANEGNFTKDNGSVSFYHYDGDSVSNNIFQKTNGRVLGDVVQSVKVSGDRAYVVVNNSNKIEVVNSQTFKEVGVIEGITSPRQMEVYGSTAYVTCWDKTVKVLDLNSLAITKSIDVGAGAEGMLIVDDKLYVANGGAYGKDSTISVIDMNTNEVVSSIELKYNPISMVLDKEGYLWALCAGKSIYDDAYMLVEESPAILYKVDLATNSPIISFEIFQNDHPKKLAIDNDGSTLYFQGGYVSFGFYKFTVEGTEGNLTKFIDLGAYGFSYNSEKDELYLTDAGDYSAAGKFIRYSTSGEKLGEYTAGIIPNGAAMKNAQ